MKCPACQDSFHPQWESTEIGSRKSYIGWLIEYQNCPTCDALLIHLQTCVINYDEFYEEVEWGAILEERLVYPRAGIRPQAPPQVPEEIAKDFNEASLVFADSPNASAALSRRCLQNIIRHCEGIKKDSLFLEVEAVLAKGHLPPYITEDLHTIRDAGNVAVHPWKDSESGAIVDIEPEEAELVLNVLESMFDFYFVQPARAEEQRLKLRKKAKEAEK
jgi:Domain of unknown function (DUF4145)